MPKPKTDQNKRSSLCTCRPGSAPRLANRAVLARHGLRVLSDLGCGSFSKVKLAHYKENAAARVAIKIVDKGETPYDYTKRFLPRELRIWPELKHPNIIKMFHYFESGWRVYMVLEFAEKGDVSDYIRTMGAPREARGRRWIMQVADAVRYLHERDISHRDLKLENLLLDAYYNIKLCDFGFVTRNNVDDLSVTFCGSVLYRAPEIIQNRPYNPNKVDIWTIGVILYLLVTGRKPFNDQKGTAFLLQQQKQQNFPWHLHRKISRKCRDLIKYLLTFNYIDRPTIHSVLSNQWLQKKWSSPVLGKTGNLGKRSAVECRNFAEDDKPVEMKRFKSNNTTIAVLKVLNSIRTYQKLTKYSLRKTISIFAMDKKQETRKTA